MFIDVDPIRLPRSGHPRTALAELLPALVGSGAGHLGSTWHLNGWKMLGISSNTRNMSSKSLQYLQWNLKPPVFPTEFFDEWWLLVVEDATNISMATAMVFQGHGWSCGIPRPWLTLVGGF